MAARKVQRLKNLSACNAELLKDAVRKRKRVLATFSGFPVRVHGSVATTCDVLLFSSS
jgi:hypothetical protein